MNFTVESPYSLCVRVCLQWIDHVGVPEDIIEDNNSAGADKPKHAFIVCIMVYLICVDKGKIEHSFLAVCEEAVECIDGGTEPELDAMANARLVPKGVRRRRPFLVHIAGDLAVFGQLFLNGGRYGNVRLLSPASVTVMTTNQIPGIGAYDNRGRWLPEACWGFGWMIQGPNHWNRWMYSHGSLPAVGTFYHEGASGVGMWVDPHNHIVGIYLSVIQSLDPETEEFRWEFDRFENMVTAAIAD